MEGTEDAVGSMRVFPARRGDSAGRDSLDGLETASALCREI